MRRHREYISQGKGRAMIRARSCARDSGRAWYVVYDRCLKSYEAQSELPQDELREKLIAVIEPPKAKTPKTLKRPEGPERNNDMNNDSNTFKLCSLSDIEESPTSEIKAATGRARCRVCGEKIAKGDDDLVFFASFTDGSYNSWTAIECHAHLTCFNRLQAERESVDIVRTQELNRSLEAARKVAENPIRTWDLCGYEFLDSGDNDGITRRSIRHLRNSLALCCQSRVGVVIVRTGNGLCAFAIVDNSKRQIRWSGDGFRLDKGGEGGAGYVAALKLLKDWGLHPFEDESKTLNITYPYDQKILVEYIEDVLEDQGVDKSFDFVVPCDHYPAY